MPRVYGPDDLHQECESASARFCSPATSLLALVLAFLPSIGYAQTNFNEDVRELQQHAEKLLLDRQYEELDGLIAEVRDNESRSLTGVLSLEAIYSGLGSPTYGLEKNRSTISDRLQVLKAWNSEKPSIAGQVALAYGFLNLAWQTRGTGLSGSVTGEGIRIIELSVDRAERALQQAASLAAAEGISDPCIPYTQMRVGFLAGYNRERMQGYLDQSLEIDPWFGEPIATMTNYLTPRWYGDRGDLLEFAEECADATKHAIGDTAYAIVAQKSVELGEDIRFGPGGFEWPRVRQGLRDWVAHCPDSPFRLGAAAHLAHTAGDRPMGRDMIERLEGRWSTAIWKRELDFHRTIRWAFDDGKPGESLRVIELGPQTLQRVCIVDEGQNFVAPTSSFQLPIYDIASGEKRKEISLWPKSVSAVANQSSSGKTDFAFHVGGGYSIERVDLERETFEPIGLSDAAILSLATSQDGQAVALGDRVGNVKFWQMESTPLPYEWNQAIPGRLAGIALSPDGKQLLGGSERMLKIWDTQSRELLHIWEAHPRVLYCLAWSPDGKTLASAGNGPEISLWNSSDGSEIGRITTAAENIMSLAFSPDGERLVAGTYSSREPPVPGQVLVCDLPELNVVKSLPGHRMNVWSVAVTPDGERIASASDDGSVRIWKMPSK